MADLKGDIHADMGALAMTMTRWMLATQLTTIGAVVGAIAVFA